MITARLLDEETWRRFHEKDTEMIITRKGRNLFPKLDYEVRGLEETENYMMALQLRRTDNFRYKFNKGEWSVAGSGEPRNPEKTVWNQGGAKTGRDWMQTIASFARIKISNESTDTEKFILQSMHRYIPVLCVYRLDPQPPLGITHRTLVAEIQFDFTEFTAVTAYQNQEITDLKVENNKYAKGFRQKFVAKNKRDTPSPDEGPSPKRVCPDVSAPQRTPPLMPLPSGLNLTPPESDHDSSVEYSENRPPLPFFPPFAFHPVQQFPFPYAYPHYFNPYMPPY
ncbi:unnamed protein product [Caenorhabditis auriculariae]|uniref:T-box domain-containing protein n=1 Tax=Caenorhabditis auriculariae TaxID=2777116 RepID=A0A8S1HM96_9PELO|nr:unnamed protein product [Caenorhabditis auriculariae]